MTCESYAFHRVKQSWTLRTRGEGGGNPIPFNGRQYPAAFKYAAVFIGKIFLGFVEKNRNTRHITEAIAPCTLNNSYAGMPTPEYLKFVQLDVFI